jgi:nitrogen fixation NifU-like protein
MTDVPLTSLYQELILEHYRHPRNKGELADHTVEAHVSNPVCGDELSIQIRLDGDRIEDIAFDGQGCSISQASMSMMTTLIKGSERSEALRLADLFTDMMHGRESDSPDRSLGDLRALQGVSKFPVRIRCALLAFDALRDALSTELEAGPTGGAPHNGGSRGETTH